MLNQTVIDKFQLIPGVRIGIDKVTLGIPLSKGAEVDYKTKYHIEHEILNSIHKPQIKQIKKPGKSATVGKYFSTSGERRILTIAVGIVWGKPYCQFCFNPNRLTAPDWLTIQEVLCSCFNYGLREVLECGVIRKLELSFDLENFSHSDFLTIVSGIRSGAIDFKGTKYCGKRNSPLSVATYDKAKQLADVEGNHLTNQLTRIEARLVLPATTLLDVAKGKARNPWDRIFIVSPKSLRKVCGKFFNAPEKAAKQIAAMGLHYVLTGISQLDKKEFRRLLRVYSLPLYDHQHIWDTQVQMIRRFFPQYGGEKYSV